MQYGKLGLETTVLCALLHLACGGSVEEAPRADAGAPDGASSGGRGGSGTSGRGGTGGTGGAGAIGGNGGTGTGGGPAGSGGSGGTATCTIGDPCVEDCVEPGCCSCILRCVDGRLSPAFCPSCPAPRCPEDHPFQGDPCDPCFDMVGDACVYDACASTGQRMYATCGPDRTWRFEHKQCDDLRPCGPLADGATCAADEICVTASGWTSRSTCQKNPCAPGPLSCECAASLCGGFVCSITPDGNLGCYCPAC